MRARAIGGIMVAACLLALLFLLTPAQAGLKGDAVKVGVIVPLAGPAVSWGQHSLIGANIACDEINASGGIGGVPLKLIVYDTASKSDQAIALTKKLTEQDQVLIILGPILSSECAVVFPVINRMNIVAVSPTSAEPGLSANNRPWAFRNNLTSDKTLEPALKKWAENHKVKKVAIIYDSSDGVSTGEGVKVFPPAFKQLGAEVIDSITVQKNDIDFSAHITRLKGKQPDGVAIAAQAEQAANIVREMRRQGLNVPVITGVECANPLFIKTGQSAVEGAYTASATWADSPDPRVKKFTAEFMKRKNGEKPNSGAFKAYDSIYIIKGIIEKNGVTNAPEDLAKDRERLREGWKALKDFPGVSGVTSINADGDGQSEPTILEVKEGRWVEVKR